jgi:hypothetical protein
MNWKLFFFFVSISGSLFSQYPNVNISVFNRPNETCIAQHPKYPNFFMAAANLNNVFVSKDAGTTWKQYQIQSDHGVWGDPVIMADTAGNFYYFHLSNPPGSAWIDRIVCQKSDDNGLTFTDGTYFGLNGTKAQDKHWVAYDANSNTIYVTWTQFDEYGSRDSSHKSDILFVKSSDGALTWSAPIQINEISGDCIDSSLTVEGAVPAVGPAGQVYVAWAGPAGLRFDKSTNGGLSWLTQDILVDSLKTGWTYDIPGLMRCNGMPVTVCDLSGGAHHGSIYINWSDQRNGPQNTDIWVSVSRDEGQTWGQPIKVNNDSGSAQQFMTWMTIDQKTGILYALFYDRRNYQDLRTDVYLAYSKDGAQTWENVQISDSSFVPDEAVFFGDYVHLVANNGRVRPIWTRMDNGFTSVWTALIDSAETGLTQRVQKSEYSDTMIFPNPSGSSVNLSFKNIDAGEVSVILFNDRGALIKTFLNRVNYPAGKYTEAFDLGALKLPPGLYFWKVITSRGVVEHRWINQP